MGLKNDEYLFHEEESYCIVLFRLVLAFRASVADVSHHVITIAVLCITRLVCNDSDGHCKGMFMGGSSSFGVGRWHPQHPGDEGQADTVGGGR